ncbi:MAG: sensor histidine kinase, partial [Chloroflexota bacterium]
ADPESPDGRDGRRPRPPWWPDDEPWPPTHGWGPRGRGRRTWSRGYRGGPFGPGFGCLFGLVFLVVIGSVVGLAASVASAAGPVATIVGAAAVLALVALLAATFRRTASTLDALVAATARVEDGDYTARVAVPRRGPPPLRSLARGFNTMAERLEADERQRRSLLADVGHELRTPLAVIQGNVEAIVDGVHPADAAHLGAILEETHVLSRLVDDLRTLTLSEAGSLPLHREPTDLAVLLGEVATSFERAAAEAGVALSVDAAADLPLVDVDPVRIREVVSNLVANALRYTPRGGDVSVAARRPGDDPHRSIRIQVRDTGAGLAADVLPHVFDRFWKSADSRGSGLGLAIARGLVEAHGGEIRAESAGIGAGTTFTVTLPTEPAP